MQIRGGTIEDSAGIAKVQVDSYRTAYAGICSDAYLEAFSYEQQEGDWRELFEANPEAIAIVAEDDKGRIIAYALAQTGSPGIPGYDAELVAIHVREKNQRMGIGRLLLWTVARELKRRGCSSLMLWSYEASAAHGFYDHMGASCLDVQRAVGDQPKQIARGWASIESICIPTL